MFDSPKRIDSESDHGQPTRLKNRNQRIDFARIEIYWVSLLLLIKDISLTSKLLFYDFELYVDELYNNIILYFQFFLTQIHKIITSCLFYEKDLTENDKKIEQEFRYRRNSCFTTLRWPRRLYKKSLTALKLRDYLNKIC